MHHVREVPPGHLAGPTRTHVVKVVGAEELHAHDGKDEDDDAQHEGQVGQGTDGVGHDGQDVVEGFPRLCQFEHSQQTEGAQHGQT